MQLNIFNSGKEETNDTCNNMDKLQKKFSCEGARHKVCTIWFHFYEILEPANLFYGDRIQKVLAYGNRKELTGKKQEKSFWGYGNVLDPDRTHQTEQIINA